MKRYQILMASLCLLFTHEAAAAQDCPSSEPVSPVIGKVYAYEGKDRPIFKWTSNGIAGLKYIFEIEREGEVILSKETTEPELVDVSELEPVFEENAMSPTPYTWHVETSSEAGCTTVTSSNSTFYVIATPPQSISSGGAEVDIVSIECDIPAFSPNGTVNYKAKVDLTNLAGSFADWDISTFTDPLGTHPVTTFYSCSSPFNPQTNNPLSINAGVTDTWCYDFSLPATTTNTHFTANGTMGGFPTIVTDISALPTCLCKVCEEWEFVSGGKSDLNYLPSQSPTFEIAQDFQISGADPIRQMHADVVSIHHKVGNEICQVCVKNATKMGTFPYQISGNQPRDLQSGWQFSNVGQAGLDNDSDGYTSQLIWTAANQLTGIDFSSTSRQLRIPIALPDHPLECCESVYEVCIRYTFTDINCKSCDILVCYKLEL